MMQPRWDELDLPHEPARMRKYRLLQSWYRELQLGVEPALVRSKRKDGTVEEKAVGSRLPAAAVAEKPWLNFISPEAAAHADERIGRARHEKAALDPNRLRQNMLSSMPLCFNVFGSLAKRLELPGLLSKALGYEVSAVDNVLCEWAPRPAEQFLGDKSAFDAVVFYRDGSGARRFLGVETKYTESFSPKEYGADSPLYAAVCDGEASWFTPGSLPILMKSKTNQLWRNTMLASAFETLGNKHGTPGRGEVMVLCLADDPAATACVAAVRERMRDPDRLHHVTLEDLAALGSTTDGLASWAKRLRHRYLDADNLADRKHDPDSPAFSRELTSPFSR